jgi:hypothetical protein
VLSTFYTVATIKEDMLSPAAVSRQVEARRREDPGYLTTKAVMLGALITKGEHLWLDRAHPQWQDALRILVERMGEAGAREGANQLMLREFYGTPDPTLDRALQDLGLVLVELPKNSVVDDLGWPDLDAFLAGMPARYRSDLRREVLRHADAFEAVTTPPQTPAEVEACYRLYEAVFERALDLNVHKLPLRYFESMCQHPDYDVLRLFLKGRPEAPVAVMFSFRGPETYHAMIVGLDYDLVTSHGTYKQALFQTVLRARALGAKRLDLAFTAEQVKKKVGARAERTTAYVQVQDHFHHAVLEAMAVA